jgi:signal transduction histidine kinase
MLNLRTYLADRWAYLLLYFVNTGLVLLVVNLGVLQRNMRLGWTENAYILLLSLFLMGLYLGAGYARNRLFYRQIRDTLNRQEKLPRLEDVLRIQSAASREQAALQQLLHDHYRINAEELLRLRQTSRRQNEFIQQWVHQMKTPVSVIDLLLQQAEKEGLSAGWKERSASIGEENERIAQGLTMILHSARLEKFEMDSQIRRIGLAAMLRQLINSHKKTWIRHALFPKLEAPEDEVYVESDAKWLEFILQQFITNAVKYSSLTSGDKEEKPGSGRKSKELRFTVRAEKDGTVRLEVKDQGVGIPSHDLPRIFDPFFTGDNGRLVKESTGMGLYIAKQVCSKLGHGLEAESVQGEGTVMLLTFRAGTVLHSFRDDAEANMTNL